MNTKQRRIEWSSIALQYIVCVWGLVRGWGADAHSFRNFSKSQNRYSTIHLKLYFYVAQYGIVLPYYGNYKK